MQLLLQSPAIHVDETQINIQGTNHHVWAFTNGDVVFKFTDDRS
jgi:hypothetical protein